MGRAQNKHPDLGPVPPEQEGTETPYGMGVSSEHDEGEKQEVDSREEE